MGSASKTTPKNRPKFIDDSVTSPLEPSAQSLTQLRDQLSYIAGRIRFYSSMIEVERIDAIVRQDKPPSSAYHKAFKAICLLLKATVKMGNGYRSIKDNELF